MGTATSRQDESQGIKDFKEDKRDDTEIPSVEENQNKSDNPDEKEPVVEEEIVPEVSHRVRSIITTPKVSQLF